MKLLINYDFFNATLDVTEKYGPLKIIRNDKDRYLVRAPIWFGIDMALFRDVRPALLTLMMQYSLFLGSDMIIGKNMGYDVYQLRAKHNLEELVDKLNEYNIRTNYEMLLETILYAKKYHVNENFSITQEKYLLVPTYNYHGKESTTDILQEHVIGSDEYILSLGSYDKKYKYVRKLV